MYYLTRSEAYKIVLPILFAIQFLVVAFNTVLLQKRRGIYPIKQLSPRLTILISFSIIITSTILLICKLTDIHKTNDATFALMHILYVFFREFIIIAFYMRCLRICAAYFHTKSQLLITIFSKELTIALVTSAICIVPCVVQIIQFSTTQDVNRMTNFFPFYLVDLESNPLDFFPLWALDNIFFFVVLVLSLKVHDRFKFLKTLIAACLLFHIQSWYYVIGTFSRELQLQMKNNFQYVIMCIHTLFLWLLISPSLRPNQFQYPLPLESNLSNPNSALLDKQTYLIVDEFTDKLQKRSLTNQENKREASMWLLAYTTFKITQNKIVEIMRSTSNAAEQDSELEIRQLLYDYVYYQIVPNLHIVMIQDAVNELFYQGQQMTKETIREDLELQHFKKLKKKLDATISVIFTEWKKTNSCQCLREEFKQNRQIINTMNRLNIGI